MKTKIVLLIKNCDSSLIVYNFLKQSMELEAIIVEKPFSKRKQLAKRIKKLGFWYTVGQVAFMVIANPLLKLLSQQRKKEIIQEYNLDLSPLPAKSYIEVNSLNSEKSRALLKELNPDLVLVNGTRIISKKTLECISSPFINIHVGITPLFRGIHGGYWAVATGRKDLFGVTIHYVDAGVDTGGIIEQIFITPSPKDNYYTYPYLKYGNCLPVLKKVITEFADGQRPPTKPPVINESKNWYHPTFFQWIRNWNRTFVIIILTKPFEYFYELFCYNLCPVF